MLCWEDASGIGSNVIFRKSCISSDRLDSLHQFLDDRLYLLSLGSLCSNSSSSISVISEITDLVGQELLHFLRSGALMSCPSRSVTAIGVSVGFCSSMFCKVEVAMGALRNFIESYYMMFPYLGLMAIGIRLSLIRFVRILTAVKNVSSRPFSALISEYFTLEARSVNLILEYTLATVTYMMIHSVSVLGGILFCTISSEANVSSKTSAISISNGI